MVNAVSRVRYFVRARVKPGKGRGLVRAINDRTLRKGFISGDDYLNDIEQVGVNDHGVAVWVETCFRDPPLPKNDRWKEYFQLLRHFHSCTSKITE